MAACHASIPPISRDVATAERSSRALRWAGGLVTLVLALVACGGEKEPVGVTLSVSRDYGSKPILELQASEPESDETAVSVLRRHARVASGAAGSVERVDGLGPGGAARPTAWFAYVNGIAASPRTPVHDGDRVWWDRHDRDPAVPARAVVGAFPEPFLHGVDGKRLPVRVECSDPHGIPCRQVAARLAELGIPAAKGVLAATRLQETLRVVVGPWPAIRVDEALSRLERGPRASGVPASVAPAGREVVALDDRGEPARLFRAATGLIAATRVGDELPVWVVTGTDSAGLTAAARAFRASTLGHKVAVLISDELPVALPIVAP